MGVDRTTDAQPQGREFGFQFPTAIPFPGVQRINAPVQIKTAEPMGLWCQGGVHGQPAAGAQGSGHVGEGALIVRDVFEYVDAINKVIARRRKIAGQVAVHEVQVRKPGLSCTCCRVGNDFCAVVKPRDLQVWKSSGKVESVMADATARVQHGAGLRSDEGHHHIQKPSKANCFPDMIVQALGQLPVPCPQRCYGPHIFTLLVRCAGR